MRIEEEAGGRKMVEEEDIEAFREGLKDKTASDLKRIVASLRSELETAKTKEEEALNVEDDNVKYIR